MTFRRPASASKRGRAAQARLLLRRPATHVEAGADGSVRGRAARHAAAPAAACPSVRKRPASSPLASGTSGPPGRKRPAADGVQGAAGGPACEKRVSAHAVGRRDASTWQLLKRLPARREGSNRGPETASAARQRPAASPAVDDDSAGGEPGVEEARPGRARAPAWRRPAGRNEEEDPIESGTPSSPGRPARRPPAAAEAAAELDPQQFFVVQGLPIAFYVPLCTTGEALRCIIRQHGGTVANLPGEDVLLVVPEADADVELQRVRSAPHAVSEQFLKRCVEEGRLLPWTKFVVGREAPAPLQPPPAGLRAGAAAAAASANECPPDALAGAAWEAPAAPGGAGDGGRPAADGERRPGRRGRGLRHRFSAAEDMALEHWVATHPGYREQGQKLWEMAASANLTRHSWAAMQNRWRRHVRSKFRSCPPQPLAASAGPGAAPPLADGVAVSPARPAVAKRPAGRASGASAEDVRPRPAAVGGGAGGARDAPEEPTCTPSVLASLAAQGRQPSPLPQAAWPATAQAAAQTAAQAAAFGGKNSRPHSAPLWLLDRQDLSAEIDPDDI